LLDGETRQGSVVFKEIGEDIFEEEAKVHATFMNQEKGGMGGIVETDGRKGTRMWKCNWKMEWDDGREEERGEEKRRGDWLLCFRLSLLCSFQS
jgi:hypothetical protein